MGPPCAACKPEVMPGNMEAYGIYQRCSGQLIVAGMAGVPLDINILAVKCIMDLDGVEDQAECMEKVQALAWTCLGEKAKRRKQEDDAKPTD